MTLRIMLVAPAERPHLGGGQARAGSLLAAGLAADPDLDFRQVVIPHQQESTSFGPALGLRLRFYGRYLADLAGQRPQVVHFFSPCSAAGFAEKTLLALAARLAGARVLINFRSDLRLFFAAGGPWRRRLVLWALRRYDGAICQYRELRDFFVAVVGLPPDRVFVVPNAVVPRPDRLAEGQISRRFHERRLIYMGSLQESKGVDTLLAAAGLLRDRNWLRHPVDILGEALAPENLTALTDLRDRLALGEAVIFQGPKFGPEKEALLERAGVLVLPSRREGFPNVVLEALQAGVPVVLARVGAAADIAAAFGEAVRLVPAAAPAAVADAVASLFCEPEAYRRAALAARRACAAFRPEAIQEQCRRAYVRLVS